MSILTKSACWEFAGLRTPRVGWEASTQITSGTVQEFHLSSVPPQVCRRVTEAQAPKRTLRGQLRSLAGP